MKASAAGEEVSEAAVGEVPADAAEATGGTVVEVSVAHVVVVVVLDGVVVVVEEGTVEVVVVVSATCGGTVVVVLVVLVLVELVEVVEELVGVVVDGLEVEVLVVVVAEHGSVVVVEDATVDVVLVVVLVGVVVLVVVLVVVSTANPVGAVDPEPIVVAAVATLPADSRPERTTDPNRTFINRTDQPGIRQSFPPPACTPVRVAVLGSEVCDRETRC